MRAARESGPDGLAGMAALVEHRDARLLRPLLAVPRVRLTATLQARGIGWIDDPSNEDRRFERVRVRQDGGVAPAPTGGRAARDHEVARAALQTLEVGPRGSPWINLSCRIWARKLPAGCWAGSSRRWPVGSIRRGGNGWSGRWRGFPKPRAAAGQEKAGISHYLDVT